MLILFKIAMTISIVWFVANLVGLTFQLNGKRPNFLMGLSIFLMAVLVGYMWDVAHLLY
jgi:hypothetical protein